MALIEDYGLIGDLETAALVSRDGAIDWFCAPRFDSGAVFASLLGTPENGHWTIQPAAEFRSTRRYRGDTLVLETELETDEGTVRLIDFMPPRDVEPEIVRIVEGVRGRVQMEMELVLRFDYGSDRSLGTHSRGHADRSRRPRRAGAQDAGPARRPRPTHRRDVHGERG